MDRHDIRLRSCAPHVMPGPPRDAGLLSALGEPLSPRREAPICFDDLRDEAQETLAPQAGMDGSRTHRGPLNGPPPVLKTGEPTGTQPPPTFSSIP